MESRKIISAGLLILIIIINLGFSLVLNPVSKEGLDVVRNPTDSDLKTMTDILNDSTADNFAKIQQIYSIAKKYTVLLAIYNNISNDCMNTITQYIKITPIKNVNGVNVDENAISKPRIEKIKGILASKSESPGKIFAIKPYICDDSDKCDKKLSTIYDNYEKIWMNMLNGYMSQLNSDAGIRNKATAAMFGNIYAK